MVERPAAIVRGWDTNAPAHWIKTGLEWCLESLTDRVRLETDQRQNNNEGAAGCVGATDLDR